MGGMGWFVVNYTICKNKVIPYHVLFIVKVHFTQGLGNFIESIKQLGK